MAAAVVEAADFATERRARCPASVDREMSIRPNRESPEEALASRLPERTNSSAAAVLETVAGAGAGAGAGAAAREASSSSTSARGAPVSVRSRRPPASTPHSNPATTAAL